MQDNLKRASSIFGAVAFVLMLSACPPPPECAVDDDCEGTEICSDEGTCEPDDRPVRCDTGGVTCTAEQVCDAFDGACKTCTATAGCSGDTAICDTAANNGMGVCKTCTEDGTGCGTDAPICDTAANSGAGACIVCSDDLGGCGNKECDTAANGGAGACVNCLGPTECAGTPETPICSAGNCVACTDSDSTATGQDEGCTTETPICDTTGASPACRAPTCVEDSAYCVGCTTNADCTAQEFCGPPTPASQCEIPATNATVNAQIQAFRDAVDGIQVTPLPIDGALVTYLKPDLASPALSGELPGFFVQGTIDGPALFVEVDPAGTPSIVVGDRISFNVTEKAIVNNLHIASAITDLTVISSEHPAQSVAPAGLKKDVSGSADAADLTLYESELVTISGTLRASATFRPSGAGYSAIQIETVGVQGNSNFLVRLPDTVIADTDLQGGCVVTLKNATYWRYYSDVQITASHASDLEVTSCPPPEVVSARPSAADTVVVTFSRNIDPASVAITDFAIGGEVIATATVSAGSAKNVVLTMAPNLTAGTQYTVNVAADAVSDTRGVLNTASSATFWGYAPVPTGLVINEIDSDTAGTDVAEFVELFNPTASPVHVGGLVLVLLNGNSADEATRVPYATYALSGAVDSTGNATDTIPAGGYLVIGAQGVLDTISNANVIEQVGVEGIQNGPDAVGLVDFGSGTVLDGVFYDANTVGYKYNVQTAAGLVLLDFQEGTNTPDDFSSSSLQRTPNGTDTDDNAADFTQAAATPGGPTL